MDGNDRGRRGVVAGVAWLAATFATLLGAGAGCGSTKMSNTARTGTEQRLLTNAWDTALGQVDFRPLTGVPVFLDTTYVAAVDQGWVISSIREAMLAQGVLLRAKVEQAQWVVEARVGAYGTDENNLLIGIPQVTVPATMAGLPAGTVPEIPLIKKTDQAAVAKLALFAYDRASGQLVWNSGTHLSTSNAKDVHIGGVGPIQSGSLRKGPEIDGLKLPTLIGSGPDKGDKAEEPGVGGRGPFTTPAIRSAPLSVSDDGFAP